MNDDNAKELCREFLNKFPQYDSIAVYMWNGKGEANELLLVKDKAQCAMVILTLARKLYEKVAHEELTKVLKSLSN